MVDLASLFAKPFTFKVEGLGDFRVDAASNEFLKWFTAWNAKPGSEDGAGIVRALLATQAVRTSASPEGLLDGPEIDALTTEQLDEVAVRFLEATGRLFAPSLIDNGKKGRMRRVRVRRTSERYDMAPRAGETERDRLLRILRDSTQDHADHNRLLFQDIDVDGLVQGAAHATAMYSQVEQHLRAADMMQVSATARLAAEFAFDTLKKSAVAGLVPPRPAWETTADTLLATSALRDWTEPRDALKAALGYESQLADLSQTLGAIDLDDYRRLSGAVSQEASYLLALRQSYDLPIRAETMASLRAFERGQTNPLGLSLLAEQQIAEWLRPGWQITASLGTHGLAGQGVVGEVLRRYDDDLATGVIFPTVVQGARAFDTPATKPTADGLATLLQRGLDAVVAALSVTTDELRRAGLVSTLALLVALAAYINDARDDAADVQRNETAARAQGKLDAQHSAEHRELASLLTASNRLLAQQVTERNEWPSSFRFVWAPAPLRVSPARDATMMAKVYRDQPVRVLETRDQWAKVEVHGYGTEQPQIGWISRSHLHARSN